MLSEIVVPAFILAVLLACVVVASLADLLGKMAAGKVTDAQRAKPSKGRRSRRPEGML